MNKCKNWMGLAVVAASLSLTSATQASLYFWDNGGGDGLYDNATNWDPDGNPGASDLAVANNSALPAISINGNWTVDSLRFSDGGGATQDSGVLSIAAGGDTGLWVGEFGPGTATYTLNGGTIVLNDANNSFDVGRNNGAVAYFNMYGGSVTNYGTSDAFFVGRYSGSYGAVNMTGGVLNGPNGDTHIGLDGAANWYQSGGIFNALNVQIGRFASPFADVELSGTAVWNLSGGVYLADGANASRTDDLKLLGPDVTFNCQGLFMRYPANLTFDAQGVGVSTMHLNTNQFFLDNDGSQLFLLSLPIPTALGQKIILIDGISGYTGSFNQFSNAPDGTIYDTGSMDWQLNYTPSNIVLVSVPDCVTPNISTQPQSQQIVVSNSVTFSVGAGGTSPEYQWQFNGTNIPGANASSYTISSVDYTNAGDYGVVVSNACSGIAVTSSNATLTVLAPHTFYQWSDAGGDNVFSNTNNWDPVGLPNIQDFAGNFTNKLLVINGNFSVDTLRLGNGGSVLQTNGTLTIANGVYTDNGLWLEFGPSNTSYTLDGGKIVINDPVDGFMVGRAADAVSTFDFLSGDITNVVGDTHIGLDGIAHWNQSGGVFKGAGVQIGRFANPGPVTATLSSNAVWDVALVLLADGHDGFNPPNTNVVYLSLVGPNVSYKSTGLVLKSEGRLVFDGTGGGISPMDLGGGQFLLNGGQLFLTNLPTVQSNGQQIVLLKNIGAYTGTDTQFTNAPDGTIYPAATHISGWRLQYQGSPATNIVLTALPLVNVTGTTVGGGNVTLVFDAGTSDTPASFVLQSAPAVSGPYTDVSPAATITQISPGVFQAVTPVSASATEFYRVRRQ